MSNRNILMTKEVYDQILDTIVAQHPETGGVLGRKNGIICKYFYDDNADINQNRYVPNVEKINTILGQWLKDDIEFAGIIHSHPEDVNELSYADIHYARKILQENSLEYVIFPLIVRKTFNMYLIKSNSIYQCGLSVIDKSFDVGNRENAKNLHAVLENASLPCESTVYRGMSSNALGKLKKLSDKELIGKVFLDKGFMSTSLESNSAFGGDVILEIHAPAGTHGLYVGHISAAGHYEEEVLFDMNQSMRIDFVTRDKFGRRLLKVTII